MIYLSASDTIRLTTTATAKIDFYSSHYEPSFNGPSVAGREVTSVSSIATTTVVEAPIRQKIVQILSFHNNDAAVGNTLTVDFYNGTTAFILFKAYIGPEETLMYNQGNFHVLGANGLVKYGTVNVSHGP